MLHRTISIVGVALLGAVATGCSSTPYPQSPVPALLSDREAAVLADAELTRLDREAGRDSRPREVTMIEPTGDGYLVAYHSYFDAAQRAPKESRLVVVKHDGRTREQRFQKGE